MIKRKSDEFLEPNFNVHQLTEEKVKRLFTTEKQEDHVMQRGQLSIIGLENLDYSSRFESLSALAVDLKIQNRC